MCSAAHICKHGQQRSTLNPNEGLATSFQFFSVTLYFPSHRLHHGKTCLHNICQDFLWQPQLLFPLGTVFPAYALKTFFGYIPSQLRRANPKPPALSNRGKDLVNLRRSRERNALSSLHTNLCRLFLWPSRLASQKRWAWPKIKLRRAVYRHHAFVLLPTSVLH